MMNQRLLQMPLDSKKPQRDEEDDVISRTIGEYGRWQLYLTFLLSLVNIPCTWHIFAPTFYTVERDSWCARPANFQNIAPNFWKNTTQPNDMCEIKDVWSMNVTGDNFLQQLAGLKMVPCKDWEFAGEGQTLISEFNLVCDRKTLTNLSEMVFLAGVAIGGLVCGILSDKYGRKRTLMASILIQTIIGTATAFVPWFELYVVLRAALGFISVSVVFSGFVLAIELVGGNWRTVAGISYLFPVSISYMTIAGMGWLLTDWRQLQLAVSLPGILFLSLWWILPESPRWLLALGRNKEVKIILIQAAKFNGHELPSNLDKLLLPTTKVVEEETENVSVMDLFKTRQMRKRTLLLFQIWFSMYLVYYGLVLNLNNLGGNLYINSVLIGAVEVPAVAISIAILLKCGRRWPMALTLFVSGIACGITVPIALSTNDLQWLITSFTMISKFSISSSNAILPVYTAELYPTTIRNIGVGASNVSAGIALMLVPYLWELISIHPSVPMSVLAIVGIIGGIAVLYLPETGSGPLKDTIKNEQNELSDCESEQINNNCCVT